ncbi:MAG: BT4734/BF3469 family protein, partial [Planctomycetota bacterium]
MAFDPDASCFRRANDPNHPTHVPLSAIVARIRSDEMAARCAEIRRVFTEAGGGQAGKDAIRELKKPLPGVTLAGTFERRANAAWQRPSGCVGIDLDDLDPEEMERAWTALVDAPWVTLLFRSPSGAGIKGAVRVPGLDEPDRDAYATAWRAVTLWLASLGLDNDQAVKDVSRLAFLAHDPGVHHNPEATTFDVERWTIETPVDPQPDRGDHGGGLRPGDDFNQRGELPDLLMHHGWTLDRDGPNQHWCRPGKTGGTSATLKDGVFYVFSSAAPPFEPNQAYGPFAVYALLEHGGDFAEAASELRRCGYGEQTQVNLTGITGTTTDDDEPIEPEPPDPGPVPVELLRVPGLVGQVMDFCLATAPYPNPVLAFCGAMALQSVLAGRRVRDEADNRSNLYLLGLANSGAGKDHPRKVNQRIMLEAGLADQVGDSFASAEGIEDRMLLTPCMLFQTDEMDALLVSIREGKDGRSERIMQALLKFYTSANAIYPMRVKAG